MRKGPLLSRVAESVYWASRYIERAENTARTIEVNLNLLLDLPGQQADQWAPLYQISGDEEAFKSRNEKPTAANVMKFLTFDESYPNSIVSCLYRARENARSVREVLSSEVFEQINKFYLMVRSASQSGRAPRNPSEFYKEIRMASHMLEGLAYATMSHGEAWHFSRMGRMLERADQTSRILDVKYFILLPEVSAVGTPIDNVQWTAVLKSCSGFEMYRKEHGRIDPAKIVEFLMMDKDFPRSMLHSVEAAGHSCAAITGQDHGRLRGNSGRKLGRVVADLTYADAPAIIVSGLHEFLDDFQQSVYEVGSAIHEEFFSPLYPEPNRPEKMKAGQSQS